MDVVIYPHPSLRIGGKSVETFDQELADTAKAMFEAMYKQQGVGLAAPQVNINKSLLVLNPSGDPAESDQELTMINPKITAKKGKEWGEEGCLSFPKIYAEVQRSVKITVTYQDLQGEEQELRANEFLARVIQHELDHIEGVVFTDRVSSVDKIRLRSDLQALEDRFEQAGK